MAPCLGASPTINLDKTLHVNTPEHAFTHNEYGALKGEPTIFREFMTPEFQFEIHKLPYATCRKNGNADHELMIMQTR